MIKYVIGVLRRRHADDSGMALLLVVSTMLIVTMTASAGLTYAMNSLPVSRHDQDYKAALAAAQAGVDDYIEHLNANDDYWNTVDCTNIAMQGPAITPTSDCRYKPTVQWDYFTDPVHNTGPAFHYDVDSQGLTGGRGIVVTSTGKSNNVSRTLQVTVGKGGSQDYVYYTDYEQADPGNAMVYPPQAGSTTANPPNSPFCRGVDSNGQKVTDIYWYHSPDSPSPGSREQYDNSWSSYPCTEITFIGGDELDGPVHFNDTPLISGSAKFDQGYQTSDPACQNYPIDGHITDCERDSGGSPVFGPGYGPAYAAPLYLADNSAQLAISAASVTTPGCIYTGSTRIVFKADGTMQVWSPDVANQTLPARCGGAAVRNATGASGVAVPDGGVIYVQASTDKHQCAPAEISNADGVVGDSDDLPLSYSQTPTVTTRTRHGWQTTTYPPIQVPDINFQLADQYCGEGNAYVEGVLKGHVTIGTANSIIVTGDIKLNSGLNSNNDMLGLVAGNSVEVYHPAMQNCSQWASGTQCQSWSGTISEFPNWRSTSTITSGGGTEIDGSIQTLQHSFYVQRYNIGANMGTLTVWGSIAQRWRGIVGQGTAGFTKAYHYDKRLKYSSPPYFPQWVNASWSQQHGGEISAAYPAQ